MLNLSVKSTKISMLRKLKFNDNETVTQRLLKPLSTFSWLKFNVYETDFQRFIDVNSHRNKNVNKTHYQRLGD